MLQDKTFTLHDLKEQTVSLRHKRWVFEMSTEVKSVIVFFRRALRCCRRTPACRVLISSPTSSLQTAWWRSSKLWPTTPRWWSSRSTTRCETLDHNCGVLGIKAACRHIWGQRFAPLPCGAAAEAGRLSWDGDRLHAGEQLQHPQVQLPLHPAGSPRPSRHGHHAKQRHEWETLRGH